ncbi:MAG: hypothetical protein JRN43_05380, partial [Nitrososphaerota archaeon]|nr:hypothetical protein [Nitrososphaerota archaeon]
TIGAIPELAPSGEDHLLRSTSVVKRISYASQKVEYETCDLEAREVLSLSFKPAVISIDGKPVKGASRNARAKWSATGRGGVLCLWHTGRKVSILGQD